ncbi:MAG: PD40 domain-containing protein [Flavobacteriales bacterium]|nr:PD40 domain-containing protein [Flavobacteriales bacterium]
MNKHIIKLLLSFLFFTSFGLSAQISDKEKFLEALYLIEDNRYAAALPLLKEVYEKDKNNANINYNLGISILNSFNEKEKEEALTYLKFASKSASPSYNYVSTKEKKAPVDVWYYLGKTQHNDYQFLEAIESFKKFRTYVNEKHSLYKEINKSINMSTYAQQSVLNPVNIKISNLGGKLNGFYPDFSPIVRIDESAIYYTSRRLREDSSNYENYDPIDGMLFEDIYVSLKEEDGSWGDPYPLNINTEGHEATVNLSIDGRTLYIYKDINGNGELFESNLEGDSAGFEIWSDPKKLGSDINTKAYETHATVTPNGKRIYFISDREGGFGGKDIYFCNRLPTGNWALSQNAGPVLNSDHNEDGVFMHPDGKTMYFSSDGHESMGGYDIMYSVDTDTGWSKPSNMGYPINSVGDDVFFVTTPDGKRAYFSSFKEEGYGEKDVYLLELIDAEEAALTLYRGEFTFVDRYVPPSGAQVTITNNTTGDFGVYTPRQRDGQFSAILEPNQSYHFVYEADAYETYEEDIYVSSAGTYQEIYKDIKLRPVRVGEGMTTIEPAPMQFADIKGGLVKNGVAMKGMKIVLLDENEKLLNQTTSDNTGEFQFAALDATQVYLIRVISEDGNPLIGYDVEVENDKGEILPFDPIDDTTYIFVPSIQPYEFYGISRAKSLSGTVKENGNPIKGLNVRLEDASSELIQQEETDEYGEFNFQKLNLEEEYRIVFEGDFPDDPVIIITNDLGQQMRFRKVRKGTYEYVPIDKPMPKALLTDIGGAVTAKGVPVGNLQVLLLRADQSLIKSASTDNVGKFNFEDLDLTKRFFIKFEGDYPPDMKLVVANEDFDLLLFRKIEEGLYQYDPIFVRLENSKSQVLGKEVTDNVGLLDYKKLKLDEYYQIIFEGNFPDDVEMIMENDQGESFTFKRVREGVYEYVPVGGFVLKSYTIDVKDELDFKETYPRPEELKDVVAYFQKYFTYNMKDISESNKEFVSFINDVAELVKLRGDAKIIITSSASKVPTRTWKTNSILTRKRAYDTKALLSRVFTKHGIKSDQYNFVDINTLITGPEYKGDYIENRSTYEKYQYVRIFIK